MLIRFLGTAGTVLLVAAASSTPVAAQTGTIQGKVTDSTGAVIVGAMFTVDGSGACGTSTARGRYALGGVAAGRRTMRVRALGFSPESIAVNVAASQVTEIDVILTRSAYQLAPVQTMVGSRAKHTAAEELAVPVDVYTVEELKRTGSTETTQILANLSPSVNFPTQPVTDATEVVRPFTLRGLSPDHSLVMINGMRRHQTALLNVFSNGSAPGSSGVDLNAFPSSAIERIEVLRDGASTQYGSDAIAGVFAFTTKDPEDLLAADRRFGLTAKGGYSGWNDSVMAGATAAGRAGAWSTLVTYTRRDGHELDNAGTRGGVGALRTQPVPQDSYSDSVLAKVVFDPREGQRLRLTLEGTRDDAFTDVLSSVSATAPSPGGVQTTGLVGSDVAERRRIALDHEFAPSGERWFERGEWRIYRQKSTTSQETFEERRAASLAGVITPQTRWREFTYEQETSGAEAVLFSRFAVGATDHTLAYGLEYVETDTAQLRQGVQTNLATGVSSTTILPDVFPVRDFPLTTTRQASAFVQDEIRAGAFTVTPGVRFDDYALRPHVDAIFAADNPGFTATDIDEQNISPKLGVMYRLAANATAYLNYAAGFRAPPSDDVNIGFENLAFGYTAIANPDLKSETSDSFELGWRVTRDDGGYLGLAGYYNLYDDFIESRVGTFDPVSGLIVFQSQNLSEVRIYGAEIVAGLPLEAFTPSLRGFTVRLAGA